MTASLDKVLGLSCKILMRPIAKYLIASGMRYSDFLEAARLAFVRAACDLNAGENASTIAGRVGVSRRDIGRARDEPDFKIEELESEMGLPAAVLSRWHQDQEFSLNDGEAKRITMTEFALLVKRVDAKIVPEKMLDELLESSSVQVHSDGRYSPSRRYFIPSGTDPRRILRFGIRLSDLANTIFDNWNSDTPVIEASAYNLAVPADKLPVLQRMVRHQAYGLLESIDDWLFEHATVGGPNVSRAGVGIYYFDGSKKVNDATDEVEA